MRMSQELARQISRKLTETKQESVDKLEKEFEEYVTIAYINSTPSEILELFKKYPDWFATCENIRLNGKGFNYDYVEPTQRVIANNDGEAILKTNDNIYHKAKKLQNAHQKAVDELKQLRAEVQTALNGLRTFAQIQKHLPEAVPYLPKSTTMELMVNFDKLRSKLSVA